MANSRVAGSHKVRSTVKRSELMRSSAANQYERSAALPRTVAVPTTVSAVGLVKTTFSWKWVRTRSTARAFHASAQSAANFSRSSRVIGHLVHRHQTVSSCDGRSAGAARDRLRGPASPQHQDKLRSSRHSSLRGLRQLHLLVGRPFPLLELSPLTKLCPKELAHSGF